MGMETKNGLVYFEEPSHTFGGFKQDDCYYIEKSKMLNKMIDDASRVEFIVIVKNKIVFVEAKPEKFFAKDTSSKEFEKNIERIKLKFIDCLKFYLSLCLKFTVEKSTHIGKNVLINDFSDKEIHFYVIVDGLTTDAYRAISEHLSQVTIAERKLYRLKVFATDESGAREIGIIAEVSQ